MVVAKALEEVPIALQENERNGWMYLAAGKPVMAWTDICAAICPECTAKQGLVAGAFAE